MPVVSRRAQEALYPSDRANRGMGQILVVVATPEV